MHENLDFNNKPKYNKQYVKIQRKVGFEYNFVKYSLLIFVFIL